MLTYVQHGARIGYKGPHETRLCENWSSALQHKDGVRKYIDKHKSHGAISGPLSTIPEGFRASPLGAFIKRRTDKLRIIVDLSWPPDGSVNDGICKDDFMVQYTSVKHAVQICANMSSPAWLAKTDLSDAYLQCPVDIRDTDMLGFMWYDDQGQLVPYKFNSLVLGLRSSPKFFEDIATCLNHIYVRNGAEANTIHYLDDFLTISESEQKCMDSLKTIISCAEKCGFSCKPSKTKGPAQKLEFLGVEIDTIKRQIQITPERKADLIDELKEWSGRTCCTKRELLSLIGKLNFCCNVVVPGHMFVRRLIQASKRVKGLHHIVHIGVQMQKDITWWLSNIQHNNEVNLFPRPFNALTAQIMFSDASDKAAAAVLGNLWTIQTFDGEFTWLQNKPIAYRELYAVVLGVATFASHLRYSQLLMNIDNLGIHYCIENGKSTDTDIMGLIRALYWYTSVHKIDYISCHLPGADNILSDSLSRLRIEVFYMHLPTACKKMSRPCRIKIDF